MQIIVNTYKQNNDQTLKNAWTNDAHICSATCYDTEI